MAERDGHEQKDDREWKKGSAIFLSPIYRNPVDALWARDVPATDNYWN